MKTCLLVGMVLATVVLAGCRRDQKDGGKEQSKKVEITKLGEVRIGRESTDFYIAYAFDAAVLGFAVSAGGPTQYFPMYGSTYRGIPPVVLEVFVSKTEQEMWVRSSWSGGETLAYRRIGSDTAVTQFGNVTFIKNPMPQYLSGGPIPFPKLNMVNVVKKATFKHD